MSKRKPASHSPLATSHLSFTWLSPWDGDLLGCPSQRYRRFRLQLPGQFLFEAQAYLRWRYNDPWQAAIIPIDTQEYRFWAEVEEIPAFRHNSYLKAQGWFTDWIENNQWLVASRVAQSTVLKAERFLVAVEGAIFQKVADDGAKHRRAANPAAQAGRKRRGTYRKASKPRKMA